MFVRRGVEAPTEAEETKVLVVEREVHIGKRIADLRFKHGFTQIELSQASGVNEITISNVERGRQKPSARTLRKLAKTFDMEVRELTAGTFFEPQFPGGAKSEEHFDAILDHEDELRERRETQKNEGEEDGPGGSAT
jgi:transcriptional regulator with XRE-family HTH domain